MPNHVNGELSIIGTKAELDAFISKAKQPSPRYLGDGEPEKKTPNTDTEIVIDALTEKDEDIEILSCNAFIPVPKEILRNGYSRSGNKLRDESFGYGWQVKNWGTKWGIYDVSITRKKRSVLYGFNTAWSPPTPVLIAMSIQHPRLRFQYKYWEGGSGFSGNMILKAGKVIKNTVNNNYRGG